MASTFSDPVSSHQISSFPGEVLLNLQVCAPSKFKEIQWQICYFQKLPARMVRAKEVKWPDLPSPRPHPSEHGWWLSIIYKSPYIGTFDVYWEQHWFRSETSQSLSTGILVAYIWVGEQWGLNISF